MNKIMKFSHATRQVLPPPPMRPMVIDRGINHMDIFMSEWAFVAGELGERGVITWGQVAASFGAMAALIERQQRTFPDRRIIDSTGEFASIIK